MIFTPRLNIPEPEYEGEYKMPMPLYDYPIPPRPLQTDTLSKVKDTNPKDAVGVTKAPLSVIPTQVLHEVGIGMLEGSLKYGRHNYRSAGVRSSVYYDATMRHLNQYWEGEDIDPDSELSHVTKAICSLMVWRDALMNNMCVDDRPPKPKNPNWMKDMNAKVKVLLEKYPNPVAPYTQLGHRDLPSDSVNSINLP